jgi:hypothetical protein
MFLVWDASIVPYYGKNLVHVASFVSFFFIFKEPRCWPPVLKQLADD